MYTTLNQIKAHKPCIHGWRTLLKALGKTEADDEPLPLALILQSNGLDDAIWALRTLENVDREIRLFAVECARQVQHLLTDPRSLAALDVAERFANGLATAEELGAAWAKAWAIAVAVAWSETRGAANDASWAATRSAAKSAERFIDVDLTADAAKRVAKEAAWASAWAMSLATSKDPTWAAAVAIARTKQKETYLKYFGT